MFDYTNLWNRLGAFHGLIDTAPRRKDMPEERPLREFLRTHEDIFAAEDSDSLLTPSRSASTLKSMARWVEIEYPNSVTELTGSFGTSVKISDILRCVADDHPLAEYYHRLAAALDADPTPRPIVPDPGPRRRQTLRRHMALIDLVQSSPSYFSKETLSDIYTAARDALLEEERGGYAWAYEGIRYPSDFLPPPEEDGTRTSSLMLDTGRVLQIAAKQDYVSSHEREQLNLAMLFYPDSNIEVGVATSDNKFWISDLRVIWDSLDSSILSPAIGSVHIDHYGSKSQFSPDPQESEFQLHFATNNGPHGEYEDTCFLVSGTVTYTANIARD